MRLQHAQASVSLGLALSLHHRNLKSCVGAIPDELTYEARYQLDQAVERDLLLGDDISAICIQKWHFESFAQVAERDLLLRDETSAICMQMWQLIELGSLELDTSEA